MNVSSLLPRGRARHGLLLVVVFAIGALCVLSPSVDAQSVATSTPDPTHVATCSNGTVVSDPTETALINDCAWLLQAQDELAGTAVLNWSGSTAITSWDGVTVGNVTSGNPPATSQRVTWLALGSQGLTGSIPAELGALTELTQLLLWDNQLSGEIPAALGALTKLTDLVLFSNQLTGSIPAALGALTELTDLGLWGNQLTGSIPEELGDLTELTDLSLSRNQLNGSIPAALGDLTELTDLRLSDNQLTGSIPEELGDLTNLTILHLSGNQLTGSIPEELGDLTELTDLSLSRNQLNGSIPAALGDLTELTDLRLSDNQLTGSIPEELGDLTNLTILHLSGNQLTGSIPAALGALTELTDLRLSDNQLTGSIPEELGDLTNLTLLYLSNNQLTGSIPEELGALTNLTILSLWGNQLTGSIPAALGDLTNLESLFLFRNQLSGSIPAELGALTNLERLYVDCNQLTGPVPSSLAGIAGLEALYLNGTSVDLPLPNALLTKPGLSINTSSYCFATAPQNVRVQPGDQQLTVTWAAPADDGAPAGTTAVAITAYNLRYRETGATDRITEEGVWTTGGGSLTYRLRGLTNGTEYEVQLRAFNDAGARFWSVAVTGTPRSGGGGGGSSTKKSSNGGGSRAPSPPPVPTRSPIIGSTSAATAKELAGDLLVLQRHDQPGVETEVGVGWISRDGQTIIVIGFVRDGDLGQTYAVVRREGDGQVVRRWIAPDSNLVYAVPWASVNTQYTFPVGVISAIPLDDQYPPPNMLMRRFDGGDDRILAYDAALGQWRHVPDEGTFQSLGFYWCNVTAADAGFFGRITLGPPYPSSGVPPRADYPVCQT